MKSETRAARCAACGHAVVDGVACDWQPDDCPYLREVEHGHRGLYFRHRALKEASRAAQEDEFDAVRGLE